MGDRYEQSYIHYYLYKFYAEIGDDLLMESARQAARKLSFELEDSLLQELTVQH
jgi:hypothetical protein